MVSAPLAPGAFARGLAAAGLEARVELEAGPELRQIGKASAMFLSVIEKGGVFLVPGFSLDSGISGS